MTDTARNVFDAQAVTTANRDEVATPVPLRRAIVVKGRVEPLSNLPFHRDGPLTRWIMANATLHPDLEFHIAIHQFSNVESARREYCDVHVHDYDEVNVFHTTSDLRVAVRLGDETIQVDAPATVFIPAGTPHSANVTSGSGFMVAILLDGEFRAVDGAG
jgi:hypothetical protein